MIAGAIGGLIVGWFLSLFGAHDLLIKLHPLFINGYYLAFAIIGAVASLFKD